MSSVTGKFEMASSDAYYDAYLKAIGVGMIQRNLAVKANPTEEITEAYGRYTLKTLTALKNTEINFVLGEEFDEETFDGRKARSTVTQDGAKLVQVQKYGDVEATIVRTFSDTSMEVTYSGKDVTSVRTFRRL
ncbi:lipocalin/fatty-acid binding family protein [Kitasatospora sp. NPDC088134]|uniref:lipocalin/fatty-acid binding family protein n=1 Tax=Kitasatospora sp. NPDC088134 TaxID=3364071 RepID=UPI0037F1E7F7